MKISFPWRSFTVIPFREMERFTLVNFFLDALATLIMFLTASKLIFSPITFSTTVLPRLKKSFVNIDTFLSESSICRWASVSESTVPVLHKDFCVHWTGAIKRDRCWNERKRRRVLSSLLVRPLELIIVRSFDMLTAYLKRRYDSFLSLNNEVA